MHPYFIHLLAWEREMDIRREVNDPHRFTRVYLTKIKEPNRSAISIRRFFHWPATRRRAHPCEG